MIMIAVSTVIAVMAVLGFLLAVFNSILESKLKIQIDPMKQDIAKLEKRIGKLEAGQKELNRKLDKLLARQ